MDALLLAALTIGLALLTSWLLHRSAGTSPTTTVSDEFFQRIHERLDQAAPSGVGEGGLRWTQTSEEVEVSMPLEAHVKARDIEFRILPVSVALRIRGATTSLLEVFQTPEPLSISPASPHPLRLAGKATTEGEERRVQLVHRWRLPFELSQRADRPRAPCCSRVDRVCRWRGRVSVAQAHARQGDANQGKLALDGRARDSISVTGVVTLRAISIVDVRARHISYLYCNLLVSISLDFAAAVAAAVSSRTKVMLFLFYLMIL